MPDPRPARQRRPVRHGTLRLVASLALAALLLTAVGLPTVARRRPGRLLGAQVERAGGRDPAGWGGDHVGRPLPEFTTGDECLFCHRPMDGPGYAENRHVQSLRPV